MFRFILCIGFILYLNTLSAQQFGAFPPSTKWKQINTDTVRLIFDSAIVEQAERIATLIHKMAKDRPTTLGNKQQKINIVLHSNTTLANGYVGLAPYRSEFYLIPGSDVFEYGNLPWSEQLAIHEYRHVQQYNNFNRGVARALGFILGEEGRGLANGASVPAWFFEGDAVHAETALTSQGRGRMPFFLSGYNSLWLQNKQYRLAKQLNGSLKDYVPNHYQFGYLLVNYGYEKYGPLFWQKVTKDASAFRGLINPFQQAVKRHSGTRYRKFIKEAFAFYQQQLTRTNKLPATNYGTVTNYYFPQYLSKDSLLYLKESYASIPAFYIRDKKGEHKIRLRNISSENWFSYRNGTIAYTGYAVNARWSLQDYSDIILIDLPSKTERRLTKEQKYFTPDLSPSGKKIAAVSFNKQTETELHLLNAETGALLKTFRPGSHTTFFLHPRFIDEEHIVLIHRLPEGSMKMIRLNITSGEEEELLNAGYNTIGHPFIYQDTVYFTGSFSANDDLYALPLKSKKLFQLTSGQTGFYYPSTNGDSLVWARFTAYGQQLHSGATGNLLWKELTPSQQQTQRIMYPVAEDTTNLLQFRTRNFPVSKYRKSHRLFNFHSWRPSYTDPEFSFSLYSDNILNTFTSELFYTYNQNERSHGTGFNAAYGGLFPVLTAGVEQTFNRHVRIRNQEHLLNQTELRVGFYVPLNFTRGNTYKQFNAGSNYVFNQLGPTGYSKNFLRKNTTTYLEHFVNWSHRLPRAVQHIYPKLGYTFSSGYRHRLDQKGYQLNLNQQVFLPGIFTNHSLVLTGAFQQEDTSNVLFSNRFANSRGYATTDSSKMWRLSANYHFPVAYPDWGLAGLVYFQRIRSNLFFDYTRAYNKLGQGGSHLRSSGLELYFDTKWWNQVPVSFGVRYSRLWDEDRIRRNVWEFIIPLDIIPR